MEDYNKDDWKYVCSSFRTIDRYYGWFYWGGIAIFLILCGMCSSPPEDKDLNTTTMNNRIKPQPAYFVDTVTVTDPDSKMEVEVCIFKDDVSKGMFGIDESWLDQVPEEDAPVIVRMPFNPEIDLELKGI